MNITLTITLAPEVLSLAEKFVQGLSTSSRQDPEPIRGNGLAKTESGAQEVPKTEPPVQETKEKITIEKVRATVQEKAAKGKKDAVKKLLTEFGAENVTSLLQEQYEPFLEKVKEL